MATASASFTPGSPCSCGCGVLAFKVRKNGHAKFCGDLSLGAARVCRECSGRDANRQGHKDQDQVLKDAAKAHGVRMDRPPTNEERARFTTWHYEVKTGESVPKTLSGSFIRHAERQAEIAAEGVAESWAVVFVLPDGRRRLWADYDAHLSYVESQEGTA